MAQKIVRYGPLKWNNLTMRASRLASRVPGYPLTEKDGKTQTDTLAPKGSVTVGLLGHKEERRQWEQSACAANNRRRKQRIHEPFAAMVRGVNGAGRRWTSRRCPASLNLIKERHNETDRVYRRNG